MFHHHIYHIYHQHIMALYLAIEWFIFNSKYFFLSASWLIEACMHSRYQISCTACMGQLRFWLKPEQFGSIHSWWRMPMRNSWQAKEEPWEDWDWPATENNDEKWDQNSCHAKEEPWEDWAHYKDWPATQAVASCSRAEPVKIHRKVKRQAESISPPESEQPETQKRFHRVNEEALNSKAGMNFDRLTPKEGVHIFLCRYHGRDMKKGEDYWYTCEAVEDGFVATLKVPAWFDKIYHGMQSSKEKAAEASAAAAFTSDPEVVEAASKLPPPVWSLIGKAKHDASGSKPFMTGSQLQQFERAVRQKARDDYNIYRDFGHRNALWDGNAWFQTASRFFITERWLWLLRISKKR